MDGNNNADYSKKGNEDAAKVEVTLLKMLPSNQLNLGLIMHEKKVSFFASILIIYAGATSAATIFTEQTEFLSNIAAGSYVEPFTLTNTQNAPSFSFGSNGFSYTVTAGPPNSNERIFMDGLLIASSFGGNSLNVTFTSGNVTAVGGEFFTAQIFNGAGIISFRSLPVTVQLNDGTNTIFIPASQPGAFVGFTSAIPITSLTVQSSGGLYSAMDNMRVGAALAVPESSTWFLFALGLGTMTLIRLGSRR